MALTGGKIWFHFLLTCFLFILRHLINIASELFNFIVRRISIESLTI